MPTIRPAQTPDAPVLAALSVETWLSTYIRAGLGPARADYVLREFSPQTMLHAIETEQVIVSLHGKGITGYARMRHDRPAPTGECHGTELVTLYVRPAMARRGIGQALISGAVSAAMDLRSTALWLTVNCKNTAAQAFYGALGFAVAGQTEFILDGKRYPNYVLRRDLPGAV